MSFSITLPQTSNPKNHSQQTKTHLLQKIITRFGSIFAEKRVTNDNDNTYVPPINHNLTRSCARLFNKIKLSFENDEHELYMSFYASFFSIFSFFESRAFLPEPNTLFVCVTDANANDYDPKVTLSSPGRLPIRLGGRKQGRYPE